MTTFGLTLFLDGRQLQAQAKLSAAQMDKLGLSATRADAALAKTGARMGTVSKVASGLNSQIVSMGVAFLGLTAVRDIVGVLKGFEQTMATVQGVTKATEVEFAALTKTARELGATTRFSAQQAGEGLLLLARAGFSAKEAMDAVAATLDLAVAGALDLARATEIAAASIRQFGLEAAEARRVADVLINTTNRTNTNVEQLGETMKFAGPVAGALGISFENAAAAAGVLGDAGIQASLAGTALRGSLAGLLQVTDQGREALEKLGLTLADVSPTTNDFTAIFTKLRDANLTAAEAVAIFGRRQASAALVLTRNVEKVRELTEANESAGGSAAEMARIMDDTLNGALLALRSAIEELFLATGDSGLAGSLRDIVDFSTQVIRALAGMTDAAHPVSTEVRLVVEGIQALTAAAGLLIGAGLVRFLAQVTAGMVGLNGAMALSPVTKFALGITAAVVAIRELIGTSNAAADGVERLGKAEKRFLDASTGGDLEGQLQALRDQSRIIDDIVAATEKARNTTAIGAGGFRALEQGAAGQTTTPILGQLRQLGSNILLWLSGEEVNVEQQRKDQEKIAKQIKELEQQVIRNRIEAERVNRERENLILALGDTLSAEALVSRFGESDVARVLGRGISDRFTKNFADTVEKAFRDSADELRTRLKGASGKVRDAIQEAVDRIALQREDLKTGVPEALRSIQDDVNKRMEAIGRDIDDQAVELTKKLREAQARLEEEFSRTRTGSREFAVSADEQALVDNVRAIEAQLRQVQQLRADVETGTREALIALEQEVAVSKSVDSLTKSLEEQAGQIGLTDKALQRYNAELQLNNAIQEVGAENTRFAAEAQQKLNAALSALEIKQSQQALADFSKQVNDLRKGLIDEGISIGLGDGRELEQLQRQLGDLFRGLGDDSQEAARQFVDLKAKLVGAFEFLQSQRRFAAFKEATADVIRLTDALDKETRLLGLTDAERKKAEALENVTGKFAELEAAARKSLEADSPALKKELADLDFARAVAVDEVTAAFERQAAAQAEANRTAGLEAIDAQTDAIREQANQVLLSGDALREYTAVQQAKQTLDEAGITNERERAAAIGQVLIAVTRLSEAERERAGMDAIQATRDQTAAWQEQINTIGLTGTALERYNTINKLRQDLDRAGILTTQEGAQALEDAKQKFDELARVRELKSVFDEVGRSLGDAFTDFITGAKSASEALEDFLKNLSRALVQKAVSSLIGGAIGGAFGGGAFAKGGVFGPGGLQPFARGGVVSTPTIFPFANGTGLMGEAGPEAILPLKRGADGTLGVEASTGGQQAINITMNISTPDADSFRKSQKQTTAAARRAIGQARGNAGR